MSADVVPDMLTSATSISRGPADGANLTPGIPVVPSAHGAPGWSNGILPCRGAPFPRPGACTGGSRLWLPGVKYPPYAEHTRERKVMESSSESGMS